MPDEPKLTATPDEEQDRELWLQHAAGWLLMRDVRGYAREQMASGLSHDARAAAEKAIDDALYGIAMIADGVPGPLGNESVGVELRLTARLVHAGTFGDDDGVIESLDLFHGDGMCMGYHGWLDGDFGDTPPADGPPHGAD